MTVASIEVTIDRRERVAAPQRTAARSRSAPLYAGTHRARQVAVELAWLWLTHQPENELSRWFRQRVGDLKGRIRRIAIVAMARKLMVALWRYLTTGVVPTGAVLRPSF